MSSKQQPLFKITLNGIDVTEDVIGQVVYDEAADMLTSLNFTLRRGLTYLSAGALRLGSQVTLFGGTQDVANQRHFFKGGVTQIRPRYPNSGLVEVNLNCYGGSYGKVAGKDTKYVYPAKTNKRGWAQVDKLKCVDIVRGLAHEMTLPFGKINLGVSVSVNGTLEQEAIVIKDDFYFTDTNQLQQDHESDWTFLLRLAKRFNCHCWTEFNPKTQQEELYFVDIDTCRGVYGKDTFVYPGRDFEVFPIKELKNGQIEIFDVSIDEDASSANAVLRQFDRIDPKTGDSQSIFYEYDPDTKEMFTYQFQAALADAAPIEEQQRIYQMGATGIPFEESVKYYKRVKAEPNVASKDFRVIGRPWLGVVLKASCDGNVFIRSKASYAVKGLGERYDSRDTNGYYYLASLSHVWDNSGFISHMEFRR